MASVNNHSSSNINFSKPCDRWQEIVWTVASLAVIVFGALMLAQVGPFKDIPFSAGLVLVITGAVAILPLLLFWCCTGNGTGRQSQVNTAAKPKLSKEATSALANIRKDNSITVGNTINTACRAFFPLIKEQWQPKPEGQFPDFLEMIQKLQKWDATSSSVARSKEKELEILNHMRQLYLNPKFMLHDTKATKLIKYYVELSFKQYQFPTAVDVTVEMLDFRTGGTQLLTPHDYLKLDLKARVSGGYLDFQTLKELSLLDKLLTAAERDDFVRAHEHHLQVLTTRIDPPYVIGSQNLPEEIEALIPYNETHASKFALNGTALLVQGLAGKIAVEITPAMTILAIKEALAQKITDNNRPINPRFLVLVFNGQELADNATVQTSGINVNSAVSLIYRRRAL